MRSQVCSSSVGAAQTRPNAPDPVMQAIALSDFNELNELNLYKSTEPSNKSTEGDLLDKKDKHDCSSPSTEEEPNESSCQTSVGCLCIRSDCSANDKIGYKSNDKPGHTDPGRCMMNESRSDEIPNARIMNKSSALAQRAACWSRSADCPTSGCLSTKSPSRHDSTGSTSSDYHLANKPEDSFDLVTTSWPTGLASNKPIDLAMDLLAKQPTRKMKFSAFSYALLSACLLICGPTSATAGKFDYHVKWSFDLFIEIPKLRVTYDFPYAS